MTSKTSIVFMVSAGWHNSCCVDICRLIHTCFKGIWQVGIGLVFMVFFLN